MYSSRALFSPVLFKLLLVPFFSHRK